MEANNNQGSPDVLGTKSSVDILMPNRPSEQYKYLRLGNGMRVLLVSDMEADKAAASVDVHVGSSHEPRELPGLAHFLEHMLFQGTDKYPGENEYSEYVKNHGGYDNAFTSLTDTNYHLECSNEGFEGALDRLAQFFICPSFSEDAAEREMNAVDSEFNQSLQHDGWHFFNLTQMSSLEASCYNRFDCGNLKTLSEPGIRAALLDFHKKWYSANIMSLGISGKFDLATLEKWAVDKFSAVENKDVQLPDLGVPHPFPADHLGKVFKVVPVKDRDLLSLWYVLPNTELDHEHQPIKYLYELIGHEGENSLLSYLKEQDLALELATMLDHKMHAFSNLTIQITLTAKGLERYEEVLEVTYKYLQMLRDNGPQQYFFDESKSIGKMRFEFMDRQRAISTCVGMARRVHLFEDSNVDQLIRANYVVETFDKAAVQALTEKLCDPANMNVFVRSHKFNEQTDQRAPWYDTAYSVTPMSAELRARLLKPQCNQEGKVLGLPPANKLIPSNFDILPTDEARSAKPILLKRWSHCTDLWFKKDDQFKLPKAIVTLRLYTNDCLFGLNPRARVFAHVWENLQQEQLREFNYMAELAQLTFDITLKCDSV